MKRRPKGPGGGQFTSGERCEQIQSGVALEMQADPDSETLGEAAVAEPSGGGALAGEWRAVHEAAERVGRLYELQMRFQGQIGRLGVRAILYDPEEPRIAARAKTDLARAEAAHDAMMERAANAHAALEAAIQSWVDACGARLGVAPEDARRRVDHFLSSEETRPTDVEGAG